MRVGEAAWLIMLGLWGMRGRSRGSTHSTAVKGRSSTRTFMGRGPAAPTSFCMWDEQHAWAASGELHGDSIAWDWTAIVVEQLPSLSHPIRHSAGMACWGLRMQL